MRLTYRLNLLHGLYSSGIPLGAVWHAACSMQGDSRARHWRCNNWSSVIYNIKQTNNQSNSTRRFTRRFFVRVTTRKPPCGRSPKPPCQWYFSAHGPAACCERGRETAPHSHSSGREPGGRHTKQPTQKHSSCTKGSSLNDQGAGRRLRRLGKYPQRYLDANTGTPRVVSQTKQNKTKQKHSDQHQI